MTTAVKVDIAWSPTEPNRFITVGTDIQLYEIEDIKNDISKQALTISERSCANIVTTSSDHQYLKCFSWYPKSDHPLLLAIGMVSGKVVFESLEASLSRDAEIAGREFAPKQNRSCNCITWNPVESNLLLQGLDKYRGENSILIWDITRSMYQSSALDAVSSFERRSVFQLEPTASKPVVEFGISESTHSIHWFHNNPKLFVCGLSSKSIKLFDMRENSKSQVSTQTKAIFNLCIDPQVEHRIASSFDSSVALWDVRNFEKPVTTMVESKSILKMCWSPTRSGLLAVLCKDSSTINLYDIQSPAMNDEVEPAIVERNLQPFASHPIMSFSWHPTQENRMLTIAQNGQLLDYKVFDRITLNWSPTSEIVWTCGRKVLQCVDSRDDFYNCLDDISVKMRRRACHGYGLKVSKIWMNAELAEDHNLEGVWMWLDFVKAAESEWKRRSNPRHQPKFEGVHTVICGENGHAVLNSSDSISGIWNGVATHCRILKYVNEERKRALLVCGWSKDSDSAGFLKFLERLENEGHFARAAAIALFNLELRKAIEVLSRGASSKNYKGNADLNAIAMALAGYTDDKAALWREISSTLKRELSDPYLRAMFTFLTAEDSTYDEILNESQIAVQDCMAFACLYLDDKKLADYLDNLKKRMCEAGDLDGIILTGLTNDGLSLIQRYVDTVGDVQTASLIVLHSLPNKACGDPRAQAWVHCYRNLLDTWKLWKPRAVFDVMWFNNNPHAHKPKQQVYVSCNFCRRTVSYHLQQYHPPLMNTRFAQTPVTPVNKKITCCPACRKPMPRCSLCLSHMGTASGLNFLRETTSRVERKKVTNFSNWLTWCQTCRHGGHSAHILEWFQHHKECPVTGCSCKCMSLDAVANLKSLTVS